MHHDDVNHLNYLNLKDSVQIGKIFYKNIARV